MSSPRVTLAATTLVISLALAAPVLAQNGSGSGTDTTSPPQGANAPTGSLVKSDGGWRSSELVGATVYDSNGSRIGTIDDLLVSSDGTVSNAVLSVGGFLGIGNKLVEVPFKKLPFVLSKSNLATGSRVSISTNPAPGASTTGSATPASSSNQGPSAPTASSAPASATKSSWFRQQSAVLTGLR